VSRSYRSTRDLRPQVCSERLGPPWRSRHHALHAGGRIHFSSCSSSRTGPGPFAGRGARSLVTPRAHAAVFAPATIMPGGRATHGPTGMVLVTTHHPGGSHVTRRTLGQAVSAYVKRAVDASLATVALVMASPVMLLSAIAIRRESAGPIIYSQVRVGLDRRRRHGHAVSMNGQDRRVQPGFGRPFRIYKFRSMVQGAEKGTGAVWCKLGDSRVTKVGNFLRKTHLDELPQLVNVIRGEMSMVGPRPERPEFVEKLAAEIPGYRQRSSVLPGITGLAQVKYRYDRNFEGVRTKLLYDLHYIRNSGLLFDAKIMAATVGVMAKVDHGQA